MATLTPVGQNIKNFEAPGVIAVISPNSNFQVSGVIEPQKFVVIKPQKSGVIVTPLYQHPLSLTLSLLS